MTSLFTVSGEINEVIFEAMLLRKDDVTEFTKNADFINGDNSHEVFIQQHVPLNKALVRSRLSFLLKVSGPLSHTPES